MNRQRKYLESKKDLEKEIIELLIKNQVIKKQLSSIRNMLNDILGTDEKVEFYGSADLVQMCREIEQELVSNKKVMVIKKDGKYSVSVVDKIQKCLNCQEVLELEWKSSFCSNCLKETKPAIEKM